MEKDSTKTINRNTLMKAHGLTDLNKEKEQKKLNSPIMRVRSVKIKKTDKELSFSIYQHNNKMKDKTNKETFKECPKNPPNILEQNKQSKFK